jgi:hypothetical protein
LVLKSTLKQNLAFALFNHRPDPVTMLVLFETPAGYALFKLTDENALEDADQLAKAVASPEKASKL